jgi:hypothetical protein
VAASFTLGEAETPVTHSNCPILNQGRQPPGPGALNLTRVSMEEPFKASAEDMTKGNPYCLDVAFPLGDEAAALASLSSLVSFSIFDFALPSSASSSLC